MVETGNPLMRVAYIFREANSYSDLFVKEGAFRLSLVVPFSLVEAFI